GRVLLHLRAMQGPERIRYADKNSGPEEVVVRYLHLSVEPAQKIGHQARRSSGNPVSLLVGKVVSPSINPHPVVVQEFSGQEAANLRIEPLHRHDIRPELVVDEIVALELD